MPGLNVNQFNVEPIKHSYSYIQFYQVLVISSPIWKQARYIMCLLPGDYKEAVMLVL